MQRKRPHEIPGFGAGPPQQPTNFYDDVDFAPIPKQHRPAPEDYYPDQSGYNGAPSHAPDSWAQPKPMSPPPPAVVSRPPTQYEPGPSMGPSSSMFESSSRGYPTSMPPRSSMPVEYAAPIPPTRVPVAPPIVKRKVTCELPLPRVPDVMPHSKYGLGIERYGMEMPSLLLPEFQDTISEIKDELAFLQRHPEVASRIPHAMRVLEKEGFKLSRCIDPEWLEVDINKPIYLSKRVLIPINRHPTFNFVGKIIGNKGATLQNLCRTFHCQILLNGDGSSRDRAQEAKLFNSGDPKYLHYGLPLHMIVSTIARPHVAHMRMAGCLNAIHKLLIPSHDIHITGITDGSTWTDNGEVHVYNPFSFDEDDDEEKEATMRDAIDKTKSSWRKKAARKDDQNNSIPHETEYTFTYDANDFDFSDSTNGMSSGPPSRGGRGAPRGGGRGRGASNGHAARGGPVVSRGAAVNAGASSSRGGHSDAPVRGASAPRGRGAVPRARGRGAIPIRRG
uniref:KH_dom_type_1 domain-containing protein n=1 Tax=Panagrellus redivivus TaxID=6233 RepID=A0A7E4VT19_PANRE